jgi:predicted enzyme related to lactoylglutathione lyase
MFKAGKGPEGHLMAPTGLTPGTVAIVRAKSVDAVSSKVVARGGKVRVPKFEVPGMGWFVYFEVPGGTLHAAFEPVTARRK